jgi:hypothetical protein
MGLIEYTSGRGVGDSATTVDAAYRALAILEKLYSKTTSINQVDLSDNRSTAIPFAGIKRILGAPNFPETSTAIITDAVVNFGSKSKIHDLLDDIRLQIANYLRETGRRTIEHDGISKSGSLKLIVDDTVLDYIADYVAWGSYVDVMSGTEAIMDGHNLITGQLISGKTLLPLIPDYQVQVSKVINLIRMVSSTDGISEFYSTLEVFSDGATEKLQLDDVIRKSNTTGNDALTSLFEVMNTSIQGGITQMASLYGLSHFVGLQPVIFKSTPSVYAYFLAAYPFYSFTKKFVVMAIVEICRGLEYTGDINTIFVKESSNTNAARVRATPDMLSVFTDDEIDELVYFEPLEANEAANLFTNGQSESQKLHLINLLLSWGNGVPGLYKHNASDLLAYMASGGSSLDVNAFIANPAYCYSPYDFANWSKLTQALMIIHKKQTSSVGFSAKVDPTYAAMGLHSALSCLPLVTQSMIWGTTADELITRFNNREILVNVGDDVVRSIPREEYTVNMPSFVAMTLVGRPESLSLDTKILKVNPLTLTEVVERNAKVAVYGLKVLYNFMNAIIHDLITCGFRQYTDIISEVLGVKYVNKETKAEAINVIILSVLSYLKVERGQSISDIKFGSLLERTFWVSLMGTGSNAMVTRRVIFAITKGLPWDVNKILAWKLHFGDVELKSVEEGFSCAQLYLRDATGVFYHNMKWVPPNLSQGLDVYLEPAHTSANIFELCSSYHILEINNRFTPEEFELMDMYMNHLSAQPHSTLVASNLNSGNKAFKYINSWLLDRVRSEQQNDFLSFEDAKASFPGVIANTIYLVNGNRSFNTKTLCAFGVMTLGSKPLGYVTGNVITTSANDIRVHEPVDILVEDEEVRASLLRNVSVVPVVCSSMNLAEDSLMEKLASMLEASLQTRANDDTEQSRRVKSKKEIMEMLFDNTTGDVFNMSDENVDSILRDGIYNVDTLGYFVEGNVVDDDLASVYRLLDYVSFIRSPECAPSMPPLGVLLIRSPSAPLMENLDHHPGLPDPEFFVTKDFQGHKAVGFPLDFDNFIRVTLSMTVYLVGNNPIDVWTPGNRTMFRISGVEFDFNNFNLTSYDVQPKEYIETFSNETISLLASHNILVSSVFRHPSCPVMVHAFSLRKLPALM